MDRTEAANALRIATTQRRNLEAETRLPHWIWAALFVYVAGLFALMDFAPALGWWVLLACTVALWAGRLAPGLRLRIAALLGRRAQTGRDLLPPATRAVLLTAAASAFVAAFLLLNAELPTWAPNWSQQHTMTVAGLLVACVLTPLAWGTDRITRKRMMLR